MIKVIELERYFTYQANIARLKRLQPAAKTPVMDLVYPTAKQDLYPKSILYKEDLPAAVKNLPVIVRGSASYAVPGSKQQVDAYEPFPVEVTKEISDAKLNDLRNLTDEDVNSYLDLQVARLKEGCKATAEALASQSLSGKLAYGMQVSPGTFDDYKADFGNPKTHTIAKKWDISTTTLADVFGDLSDMSDKIGEDGFDSTVVVLCGALAFKAAVSVISAASKKGIEVSISANEINMPGFRLIRASGKHYNYKTKAWVKGIADTKVCAVGTDAPFWFPYCSLDNAEANFKAMPFWTSVKRSVTGKGYVISGESKPFPVPIVNAICWADTVSS
jgi:hypothetical protein